MSIIRLDIKTGRVMEVTESGKKEKKPGKEMARILYGKYRRQAKNQEA